MERAQPAHRKRALRVMAPDPSNRAGGGCGFTVRARTAAERANYAPRAALAAAKVACGVPRPLMYAFRPVWPMAGACVFQGRGMPGPWARRQAICICAWSYGRIHFLSAEALICTPAWR